MPTSSSMWIQETYCSPPASGPPTPSLKGGRRLGQEAALRVEHVAGADDREAQPQPLRLARGRLPFAHDVGVEALAAGRVLVDERVAAVSVEPDRRLADQHTRPALEAGDRAEQVAGAGAAALEDALLCAVGPALVDLLAEQVDDAVDALEGCRGRPFQHRLPAVPVDARARPARALAVPGQADDLVAAVKQGVAERRAEEAARSGDEDPHLVGTPFTAWDYPTSTVENVPVSSLTRARPSRLASSTTASATFGATSRLKTLGMM